MTPQEQQMLQGLTDRINQTQLSDKDPEAEQFIFQKLGRNTDSLYILAQTVLVQQYALDNAKKQLDEAKQQLDQARQQAAAPPQKHTSFLGSLLGTDEPSRPAPPPPPPSYGAPQFAPPSNYAAPSPAYPQGYPQPSYGQPGYAPPMAPASGGFLRSAMQTATGVAAGALAFEGIESLMHGFGHSSGFGGGMGFDGGMGSQGRPEEIINNNYYGGAPGGSAGDTLGERAEQSSSSPDVEDRRDDSRSFADTSSTDGVLADDTADDSTPADDTLDDSQDNFTDDSSSFDSGSDDNS